METLEKYARALEVPLYRLFHDGDEPPRKSKMAVPKPDKDEWGAKGKEHDELLRFAKRLSKLSAKQRRILLDMALRMTRRSAN